MHVIRIFFISKVGIERTFNKFVKGYTYKGGGQYCTVIKDQQDLGYSHF